MKIISIVGARPQFIKCAPVLKILSKKFKNILVHTGQHYDFVLSKIFFGQLEIPNADYNLEVGSGNHGWQTGKMLIKIEEVLLKENPNYVIVYGDTNSTLAGALASAKLNIPCAHVESGLRSNNREMPEEINRIAVDHISETLFSPSVNAIKNLKKEGLSKRSVFVGDVMVDVLLENREIAYSLCEKLLKKFSIKEKNYNVLTVHRAKNTKTSKQVLNIIRDIESTSPLPIIFPVHPRVKDLLSVKNSSNISFGKLKAVNPFSYLEMIALIMGADSVITDSGGLQKEAYLLEKPCITLRNETEWIETTKNGWNQLVGTDKHKIDKAIRNSPHGPINKKIYGQGNAAYNIYQYFINYFHI